MGVVVVALAGDWKNEIIFAALVAVAIYGGDAI